MEIVNSEIAQITYDNNDYILYEKIFGDIELNISKINNHLSVVNRLTNAEEHVVLIDATDYFFAEFEALKYFASVQKRAGRLATAFYTNNLANRLTLLCIKFMYTPPVPIEIFSKKEEALKWVSQKKRSLAH